jgi:hypothetical protein
MKLFNYFLVKKLTTRYVKRQDFFKFFVLTECEYCRTTQSKMPDRDSEKGTMHAFLLIPNLASCSECRTRDLSQLDMKKIYVQYIKVFCHCCHSRHVSRISNFFGLSAFEPTVLPQHAAALPT